MCTHSSDTLIFCFATVNHLVYQFSAYGDKLLISKLMISKTFSEASNDHSQLFLRHVYIQPERSHLKPAFRAGEMEVESCPNVLHCHYNASQDAVCILQKQLQWECTANGISCVGSIWHCYRISTANLNTHLMHSKIQNVFCNSIWTSIHKTKWNKYVDF